ncbi:MAG: exodeoxyribonuclease V subunit gamma, partial [Sedimentisphaerales bacterium]|nr:exodeoxyribonuclease V subunit gamma [Sedimentisphaerales bacterium]
VGCREPLFLPGRDQGRAAMPRFAGSPFLTSLEQEFLKAARNEKGKSEPPKPCIVNTIPESDVMLIEVPTRRQEVEAAARQILFLCREKNYRFKDMAVILRDFTDYQELLEAVFTDYGIAYFIDRRRPVSHHPLVGLLCSALQVLISDFKRERIVDYLKTDLVPVPREVVDALENYALAHGLEGQSWYDDTPWTIGFEDDQPTPDDKLFSRKHLNAHRLQAMTPLMNLRHRLYSDQYDKDRKFTVQDISTAVFSFFDELGVSRTLTEWYQTGQARGDLDAIQKHSQVYAYVIDLLDEAVEVLGDTRVTIEEYTQILSSALHQMTLRLIPPALDQVLIGTIERSRHPQIRAALVLGVNEQIFPQVRFDDSFFSDSQRRYLSESGLELGPTGSERLLQERYLAYIALTRPRELLWVSYPLADDRGNRLNPSCIIGDIQRALRGAPFVRLADSEQAADPEHIVSPESLFRALGREFSLSRAGAQLDPLYKELYHYARSRPDWIPSFKQSLAGVTYVNNARLDDSVIRTLFPSELRASVSRLESYAACPFQFYARYTLRLRQRDELKLTAPDLGSFYHNVMYYIFQEMKQAHLDWRGLDDERLDKIIDKAIKPVLINESQFTALREQSWRNQFLLAEGTQRLIRFCRSLRELARAGNFYQQGAELEFGLEHKRDRKGMAALEMPLPAGRTLYLAGQIDRADTCRKDDGKLGVCIIDYKSSARAFDFAHFYHGLSLQLVCYLKVLQEWHSGQEGSQVEPAAALYLPIYQAGKPQPGMPPETVLNADAMVEARPHKATGIINEDWVAELDSTVQPKESSSYFNFYINKDGQVRNSRNKGVVNHDEMSALLEHCQTRCIELAGGLAGGYIDVTPYRLGDKETPCSHCEFASFCRFDFNNDYYRLLNKYHRQQVLDKLSINRERGTRGN